MKRLALLLLTVTLGLAQSGPFSSTQTIPFDSARSISTADINKDNNAVRVGVKCFSEASQFGRQLIEEPTLFRVGSFLGCSGQAAFPLVRNHDEGMSGEKPGKPLN